MRRTFHLGIENTRHAYRRIDTLPVPVFLCPALQYTSAIRYIPPGLNASVPRKSSALKQKFQSYVTTAQVEHADVDSVPLQVRDGLPFSCPGCGALTQTADPDGAGFYSRTRKSIKALARDKSRKHEDEATRQVYESALANVGEDVLKQLGVDSSSTEEVIKKDVPSQTPVCDRCHDLLHHHYGVPISHPTLQSIQDTISESPHNHNHIYHVLDAADFPMSLIPNLHHHLSLTPQRSQNRRSKAEKYYHGRKAELSFIITRSDLLAPKKEQVDTLMPYLVSVLRDALGSSGKDIRLGNVRCVSSKRGWWTKEVKKDIRERGGGGWMVGKVNVGKSNLFECVFPKGGNIDRKVGEPLQSVEHGFEQSQRSDTDIPKVGSLLPPAQPETAYPVLPIVSSLPGTTASPIRIPFGNGRGELVDLPGLARGDLALYARPQYRDGLVMRQRVTPNQYVIKPTQSLLLGGLIRITPTAPEYAPDSMDGVFVIAHTFVPLSQHLTATAKAQRVQTQEPFNSKPEYPADPKYLPAPKSILNPGAGESIRSVGRFQLNWEVTKQHTGPLTSKSAAKINPERLAFRIFSTDILIEGCGWVELTAQVSKSKLLEYNQASADGQEWFPEVEVFSPEGKCIGARKPMNAWLFAGKKKTKAKTLGKGRPRPSMKGAKRREKALKPKPK